MAEYIPGTSVTRSAAMSALHHAKAPDDTEVDSRASMMNVDYLSHQWQEEDVWTSWRHTTRHKNDIANGVRLENASWRTWWKQRNKLKTISPETLNWLKDSDVTWLYGPLHTAADPVPPPKVASTEERLDLVKASPAAPKTKPILKHRSISELLAVPGRASSPSLEAASIAMADDGSPGSERPPILHTKSDTHLLQQIHQNHAMIGGPHHNHHHHHLNGTSDPQSPAGSSGGSDTGIGRTPSPRILGSDGEYVGSKKHISFNTFVEQCIAIDKPRLATSPPAGIHTPPILGRTASGGGRAWDDVPFEDSEDPLDDYEEDDDDDGVLNMRRSRESSISSTQSRSSSFRRPSLTPSVSSEHFTIAHIAPTMLKTLDMSESPTETRSPPVVFAPPLGSPYMEDGPGRLRYSPGAASVALPTRSSSFGSTSATGASSAGAGTSTSPGQATLKLGAHPPTPGIGLAGPRGGWDEDDEEDQGVGFDYFGNPSTSSEGSSTLDAASGSSTAAVQKSVFSSSSNGKSSSSTTGSSNSGSTTTGSSSSSTMKPSSPTRSTYHPQLHSPDNTRIAPAKKSILKNQPPHSSSSSDHHPSDHRATGGDPRATEGVSAIDSPITAALKAGADKSDTYFSANPAAVPPPPPVGLAASMASPPRSSSGGMLSNPNPNGRGPSLQVNNPQPQRGRPIVRSSSADLDRRSSTSRGGTSSPIGSISPGGGASRNVSSSSLVGVSLGIGGTSPREGSRGTGGSRSPAKGDEARSYGKEGSNSLSPPTVGSPVESANGGHRGRGRVKMDIVPVLPTEEKATPTPTTTTGKTNSPTIGASNSSSTIKGRDASPASPTSSTPPISIPSKAETSKPVVSVASPPRTQRSSSQLRHSITRGDDNDDEEDDEGAPDGADGYAYHQQHSTNPTPTNSPTLAMGTLHASSSTSSSSAPPASASSKVQSPPFGAPSSKVPSQHRHRRSTSGSSSTSTSNYATNVPVNGSTGEEDGSLVSDLVSSAKGFIHAVYRNFGAGPPPGPAGPGVPASPVESRPSVSGRTASSDSR